MLRISGDIDGFVLTGGLSSRMGRDKSQLPLDDGRTMTEHAASAIEAVCARRFIVGKPVNKPAVNIAGLEFVSDAEHREVTHAALVGLLSAFSYARTEWVAVVACDLPFASGEFFSHLASVRSDRLDAVVPCDSNGRPQPLCALYRREPSLAAATEMIQSGEMAVRQLLARLRTVYVTFSEFSHLENAERFLLNLNTLDDYEEHLGSARNG
jgi:molybdopterin-guanine dinucleotide biosynthesis protein A